MLRGLVVPGELGQRVGYQTVGQWAETACRRACYRVQQGSCVGEGGRHTQPVALEPVGYV